jgi:hypothetical protein
MKSMMNTLATGIRALALAVAIIGCGYQRPVCPILPKYPGATALSYTEEEKTTRTTIYSIPS